MAQQFTSSEAGERVFRTHTDAVGAVNWMAEFRAKK